MDELDSVFERLAHSRFRSSFKLRAKERDYLNRKGLDLILGHGKDFIEQRLAPANPQNDGRQTPMRNHPVFVAQHATATCCRGCLEKWHSIPRGRAITLEEQGYVLAVIRRWLCSQIEPE
jgi:exodeoxyribonuclease V alpha subunit